MMITQCKGKDLDNVPVSRLEKEGYYYSTKFDGNYVQIHKVDNEVKFYTSGNKEFFIPEIAKQLIELNDDNFIIECEYIGKSDGKLGDRVNACKLTTYRTNFEKDLITKFDTRERFKAFDLIMFNTIFEERMQLLSTLNLGDYIDIVDYGGLVTIDEAKNLANNYVKQGFEGIYLKHKDHIQWPGKRINNAIKLKPIHKTVDLVCIDIIEGEGKYVGMIGSLVLQDKAGRIVSVGSGLNDSDRSKKASEYIDKIIEIKYEQIIQTYIQPTFICIREDKKDFD